MRRIHRYCVLLPVVVSIYLTSPVFAQPTMSESLAEQIVEHRLENGMTLLLLERHEAPVFSTCIRFLAGGVNEPKGKTGIAHMFEHMAFKGTKHLGTTDFEAEKIILDEIEEVGQALSEEMAKGERADVEKIAQLRERLQELQKQQDQYIVKEELWDTYEQNGASGLNASTSQDMTSYYVSLPSNRLELWALIESQRMLEPVLREFYQERDVVAEERRRGYEDRPSGKLYERFNSTAFIAHPYRDPTIGWMPDILSLTMEDAREFYSTYYIPSRTVIAIVGDIDIDETISLVEKYFSRVPGGKPPEDLITEEPPQGGERRTTVVFDAEPQIMIGYHKPTLPEYDDYVFDILYSVLTNGRTSRLYSRLVKQDQVATSVYTFGAPGSGYPNLFVVGAQPRYPHTADEVEGIIYEELDRIKEEGVSEHELTKVKNQLKADFLRQLRSNKGLADKLSYFEVLGAGWEYPVEWIEVVDRIGSDDVQRVAAQYLTPENRTVATLVKKKADAKPE